MTDHSRIVFEIQTQIITLLELQTYIQKQINELEEKRQKHEKHLQRNQPI